MIIKLNEIRESGETFDFTRQDSEMTAILDDILKGSDFKAQVRIIPAGQAFDLKGKITATVTRPCSFCASDFELSLQKTFHDILMVGTKIKTDLKGSEADFEDGDLEAIQLESNSFNVSESLHEQLALAEPFQPMCKEDCKGLCLECGTDLNFETCGCVLSSPNASKTPTPNAFSVLKSLKLN